MYFIASICTCVFLHVYHIQDRRRAGHRSPVSDEGSGDATEEGAATGASASASQEQLQSACGPLQVTSIFHSAFPHYSFPLQSELDTALISLFLGILSIDS